MKRGTLTQQCIPSNQATSHCHSTKRRNSTSSNWNEIRVDHTSCGTSCHASCRVSCDASCAYTESNVSIHSSKEKRCATYNLLATFIPAAPANAPPVAPNNPPPIFLPKKPPAAPPSNVDPRPLSPSCACPGGPVGCCPV